MISMKSKYLGTHPAFHIFGFGKKWGNHWSTLGMASFGLWELNLPAPLMELV